MHKIYKYPVMTDWFQVEMPLGARVLSVVTQHGQPQMWALVDTDQHQVERRQFHVFGTGHPIEDIDAIGMRFVGTFLIQNDTLVFHVFEAAPRHSR